MNGIFSSIGIGARRVIKNLKITLKDFEGMVKNPKWLKNGRDIQNFSLRPREAWANWLLCAVLQKIHDTEDITFAEGTKSDDGIIVNKKTGRWIITEHVSALGMAKGEVGIIERINLKIAKGPQYAKNKFLIIFFDGAGKWYRNKVRQSINGKHNFQGVYLIGLLTLDEQNGYAYSVTELKESDSISFKVQIKYDFSDWQVNLIR